MEVIVSVTDLTGKITIFGQNLRSGVNTMDISSLSSGMYILTIATPEKTWSQRFIKN
jgi:hypothetical protein